MNEFEEKSLKEFWKEFFSQFEFNSNLSIEDFQDEYLIGFGKDHPDQLVLRWLKASKWNIQQSIEKFLRTFQWRKQMNISHLVHQGDQILNRFEYLKGKCYLLGEDRLGHPVIYIHVNQHLQGEFPLNETIHLTLIAIETTRILMNSSKQSSTIVLDLKDFQRKNFDFQLIKIFFDLLENHYPESLFSLLVVNSSILFQSFWLIIKQMFDPLTEKKIRFLKHENGLLEFIDKIYLPRRFNGNQNDFHFNDQVLSIDEETIRRNFIQHQKQNQNRKEFLEKNHRELIREFFHLTFQWTNSSRNSSIIQQRNSLIEQIRKQFIELLPMIFYPNFFFRFAKKTSSLMFDDQISDENDQQNQISFF